MSETPPLGNAQKKILIRAERTEIADVLSTLAMGANGVWLPLDNPYVIDANAKVKADKGVGASDIGDFTAYVAASAFVHCGDSWSYLGRAMAALMSGDVQTAIHLAYYAELRAAISLLASEGVYVGNGYSIAVSAAAGAEVISKDPTHRAAWQCLDAWMDGPRAAELLGAVLKPGNTSMSAWIDAMPAGGLQPIIANLLKHLAFDLLMFSNDRERRNDVSYNPSRIVPVDLPIGEAFALVDDFWDCLEPDAPGGFPNVDTQLVTEILVNRYLATSPGLPIDTEDWTSWLSLNIPSQHLDTSLFDELQNAPMSQPRMQLISDVIGSDPKATVSAEYVRDMVGRAVVLLRLATGSSLLLGQEADLTPSALDPWVSGLSVARGLWAEGDEPLDALDLWQDVQAARELIDVGVRSSANFDALQQMVGQTAVLAQTERVVAWSIKSRAA